jgi:hypothetical protein
MTPQGKSVTWQYLGMTLVGALSIVAFWLYTDTRADIKRLQEYKADKADIQRIELKIDKVFDYMVDHREQTEK